MVHVVPSRIRSCQGAQAEQRICPLKSNITFLILVKTLRGVAVGEMKRTLEKKPIEDTGRKARGLYTSGTDHRSGVAFMEGLHADAM